MLFQFVGGQNDQQIRARQLACDDLKITMLIYSCIAIMFSVYAAFNAAAASASGAVGHLLWKSRSENLQLEEDFSDTIYAMSIGSLLVQPMYMYSRNMLEFKTNKSTNLGVKIADAMFSGSLEALFGAAVLQQLNSRERIQYFVAVGAIGHCIVDLSLLLITEKIGKNIVTHYVKTSKFIPKL